MRIVIEIEGDRVTALGSDGAARETLADVAADFADGLPGEPPASLLERAKKLGAMSAGAAQFGTGAALAAVAPAGETPKLASAARGKGAGKQPRRRKR